jgi:hypothetical protein
MATVLWVFLRTLIAGAFTRPDARRPYSLAAHTFFRQPVYRLKGTQQRDPLVGLRLLSHTLRRLWGTTLVVPDLSNVQAAVMGGIRDTQEQRFDYVEQNTGQRPDTYFLRPSLQGGEGFLNRLLLTWALLWLAAWVVPLCLVSRRRANLAILLICFVEDAQLVRMAARLSRKEILLFDIYENDCNTLTLALQRKGIKVSKVASDVPLAMANPCVIADELFCCQPWQLREIEFLRGQMKVGRSHLWTSENALSFSEVYDFPTAYAQVPIHTLGFYSSAAWLRQQEDFPDLGDRFVEVEQQLVEALRDFLQSEEGKGVKLTVFFHPLEKRDAATHALAVEHYRKQFAGAEIHFRPMDAITAREFHLVDLAVSVYSKVSLERLRLGFKSLIFPMGMGFIAEGHPLRAVSPQTVAELHQALADGLRASREGFLGRVEGKAAMS